MQEEGTRNKPFNMRTCSRRKTRKLTLTTVLAESDAAQVVLVASVRLLSESGHGLPRVGAVVDARLGERLVRVRVRVRVRDRDRGLGFGSGLVSASEMRKRM